jgi:N-acetylmuramoyl-L-alanine amidase
MSPRSTLAALGLLAACAVPDAVATAPPAPDAAVATAPPAPEVPPVPAAPAPPLVERPLPWDAGREALTLAYLRAHRTTPLTGDPAVDARLTPRVVVLHWTAGPTADSAWHTFAAPRLAGRPDLADAGALNVGAHYLVDRDGTILRLAPEERVLRHCIGLNHVAIGIENVGGGDTWPLTDAQVAANAALVRWIAGRQPVTHLIGHLEYRALEGHPYFEERDPTYRTTKPDPGAPFMAAVRARVADLGLAGPK